MTLSNNTKPRTCPECGQLVDADGAAEWDCMYGAFHCETCGGCYCDWSC